jgi:hypothetical protein
VDVIFTRIGERRYAVTIERPGQPLLTMRPAPGYNAYLPHDLVHFTVEAEAGIELGVFGQVAAGGTAGTFWPADPAQRRKLRKRSSRLAAAGRSDSATSERMAAVALRNWERRAGAEPVGDATTQRIQHRLDEYAALWHALPVGGSLTLTWPGTSARKSA